MTIECEKCVTNDGRPHEQLQVEYQMPYHKLNNL